MIEDSQTRDGIYLQLRTCTKVPKDVWEGIVKGVQSQFAQWDSEETRNYVKNTGKKKDPESEDIRRLSEAATNKSSGKDIIFVSEDAHFVCRGENIERALGIAFHNFDPPLT